MMTMKEKKKKTKVQIKRPYCQTRQSKYNYNPPFTIPNRFVLCCIFMDNWFRSATRSKSQKPDQPEIIIWKCANLRKLQFEMVFLFRFFFLLFRWAKHVNTMSFDTMPSCPPHASLISFFVWLQSIRLPHSFFSF